MSSTRWDKVELTASYVLLTILATELLTRLGLVTMFPVPTVDLVLSVIATVLVIGAFWFARRSRALRFGVIAFAAATQLVPMVIRQPILLLPLLGAAIPVAIMLWAMFALSKKGRERRAIPDTMSTPDLAKPLVLVIPAKAGIQ